jgi:16S rRNA A1518/A1519 N6-dimethyltransferase RsmA/KsgA/DIM1 with predicted DNA glycosylase/AP lyase activity
MAANAAAMPPKIEAKESDEIIMAIIGVLPQNAVMQTLQEIRELLESFGLAPQKRFGQNFLIDQNLLLKLLELAEVDAARTILEVGPGTGSLTEELLARAGKVVAVEIDSGMHRLLQERFLGNQTAPSKLEVAGDLVEKTAPSQSRLAGNLVLLHQDILVGKHAMAPEVVEALGLRADLVSNLPYNIATPVVAQCLVSSWEALKEERKSGIARSSTIAVSPLPEACANPQMSGGAPNGADKQAGSHVGLPVGAVGPLTKESSGHQTSVDERSNVESGDKDHGQDARATLFSRLTFTVQQEVADRMVAPHGSWEYGPVSVIVALLGKAKFGHAVPNTSFWPKPQIASRMMRIDFDAGRASLLADIRALKAVVALAFGQRRKQIGSVIHRKNAAFEAEDFSRALDAAGIPRTLRAEQITPEQFLAAANALAGKMKSPALDEDVDQ